MENTAPPIPKKKPPAIKSNKESAILIQNTGNKSRMKLIINISRAPYLFVKYPKGIRRSDPRITGIAVTNEISPLLK